MLIKNIEQRIIINKIVSLGTVAFAVIIVLAGFFFAYKMIQDSRKSIYILDNGVPNDTTLLIFILCSIFLISILFIFCCYSLHC